MSYIDELEAIKDEVAFWGLNTVNTVVGILSPNGRGFLEQPVSDEEKLQEYLTVRGDEDAWREWINNVSGNITQQLLEKGLTPEEAQSANPTDIARAYAIKWSRDSERLISNGS